MATARAEENRNHILRVAEKLFAAKGFDATSVDSIAKAADINKALIYYYFQNKDDIIGSLFRDLMAEMNAQSGEAEVPRGDPAAIKRKIAREIDYLCERREIIALLLMESLKEKGERDFLFQIADGLINRELEARGFDADTTDEAALEHRRRALVHEFFTGVIPIVAFVSLREKFCAHFDCDAAEVDKLFLDAFESSHMASSLKADSGPSKTETGD
ncbi:MAG: TetR/AcrR family transcriptional regulator [Rhodospirillales bacterium]|nr:TetR/AcrR family transcriptional regulator [Rhodospirillales bacterium]